MANHERNDRSTSELSLCRRVIAGDEDTVAVIFSNTFDESCARWHARYFTECAYALSDLRAETEAYFRADNWKKLQEWGEACSLQHHLEVGIIEICHRRVRHFGLFPLLWRYEQDWMLRDRVMTGDSKAVDELKVRCRSMIKHFTNKFFSDGSLPREDLEQEFLGHLLPWDYKRLWVWAGRASLSTYLSTLLLNLCRERRDKENLSPQHGSISIDTEKERIGFWEPVTKENQFDRVRLLEAAAQLTEARDRVFIVRLLEGMNELDALEDLADEKNRHNIKSRAFKRLRGILGKPRC